MMKKVSLSQLLSRSPRHGGNTKRVSNGEVVVDFPNTPHHDLTTPSNTQEKATKKKSKGGGILQTLKKKISDKLDTFQSSSAANPPKKSKSVERLSNNSFGDSFSQSVSEESSSDGLTVGAGSHKTKHSKRAIRPVQKAIGRQNSSSHVLTDGESDVVSKGRDKEDGIASNQTGQTVVSFGKSSFYISDSSQKQGLTDTLLNGKDKVPQVLVESVGCEESVYTSADARQRTIRSASQSAITETSSPQPNRTCGDGCDMWDLQDASLDASKRSLAEELFRLAKFGWYWGPITRAEAEEKLLDQPDGAFLVRDSSDDKYLLSLSFRSFNKTLHTRIEHSNGWFSFYPHPEHEGHTSLVGLIEHSMSHSESGVFCYSRARQPGSPSFPVRLTKPVSRFTQVRTLQYLCRFVIRQYTRVDHIQALPLPTRIKGYLEEGHY